MLVGLFEGGRIFTDLHGSYQSQAQSSSSRVLPVWPTEKIYTVRVFPMCQVYVPTSVPETWQRVTVLPVFLGLAGLLQSGALA
jgi:hypothetical protein